MALNDLFAEELKGPLKDFAIEVRFGDDQAETVDLRWQSRPHRSFFFLHRSRLSRQILSCNQIWRRISNSRYFEFRFLKIFDFIREFIGTFSTEVDEIQRLECTNRQISSSCEQYTRPLHTTPNIFGDTAGSGAFQAAPLDTGCPLRPRAAASHAGADHGDAAGADGGGTDQRGGALSETLAASGGSERRVG